MVSVRDILGEVEIRVDVMEAVGQQTTFRASNASTPTQAASCEKFSCHSLLLLEL